MLSFNLTPVSDSVLAKFAKIDGSEIIAVENFISSKRGNSLSRAGKRSVISGSVSVGSVPQKPRCIRFSP